MGDKGNDMLKEISDFHKHYEALHEAQQDENRDYVDRAKDLVLELKTLGRLKRGVNVVQIRI